MSQVFIEIGRGDDEFVKMLQAADPSIRSTTEERLDGVIEILRIAVTMSPAIAFVIGKYFHYLESKTTHFTMRDKHGLVLAAKGDGADQLISTFREIGGS